MNHMNWVGKYHKSGVELVHVATGLRFNDFQTAKDFEVLYKTDVKVTHAAIANLIVTK